MFNKVFRIAERDFRPILAVTGACLATDRIVVDGCKVGYCYREPPQSGDASGWRFFAGDEELAYREDADNRCVVVEDSEVGLAAAKSGGMHALHYAPANATRSGAPYESFNHMSELLSLIDAIVATAHGR